MNRVALTVSSAAVTIIVSIFVLRRPAGERANLSSSRIVESPAVRQPEPASTPPIEVAKSEPTPATAASLTVALALAGTDETEVDFETLAAAVPIEQIPAMLARLSESEHDQN